MKTDKSGHPSDTIIELVFYEGRVVNANLTDYKMPTAMDLPVIESILVERASQAGPFGAKGVGAPPCIEPLATTANAVAAAIGVRITHAPITAEKLLRHISAQTRRG